MYLFPPWTTWGGNQDGVARQMSIALIVRGGNVVIFYIFWRGEGWLNKMCYFLSLLLSHQCIF